MTETPEDIAALYSRARIEWTRYWDFSASRKQVRKQLRLGVVREPLEWPTPALSQPEEELPQAQPQEGNIENSELQDSQAQEAPQVQTADVQATETEPQAPP